MYDFVQWANRQCLLWSTPNHNRVNEISHELYALVKFRHTVILYNRMLNVRNHDRVEETSKWLNGYARALWDLNSNVSQPGC